MRGIDPRTSRMLSERSTVWATSPQASIQRTSAFVSAVVVVKRERLTSFILYMDSVLLNPYPHPTVSYSHPWCACHAGVFLVYICMYWERDTFNNLKDWCRFIEVRDLVTTSPRDWNCRHLGKWTILWRHQQSAALSTFTPETTGSVVLWAAV